jgi:hypothetical protein
MSADELKQPAVAGPHTPTVTEAANSYIHAQRLAGVDAATALAEFARFIATVKAEVWDLAYKVGAMDTLLSPAEAQENPYRSES